jgi:hypothetical protein
MASPNRVSPLIAGRAKLGSRYAIADGDLDAARMELPPNSDIGLYRYFAPTELSVSYHRNILRRNVSRYRTGNDPI